jgi:hypothetical protein
LRGSLYNAGAPGALLWPFPVNLAGNWGPSPTDTPSFPCDLLGFLDELSWSNDVDRPEELVFPPLGPLLLLPAEGVRAWGQAATAGRHRVPSPFFQHWCSEEVRFEISALSLVSFHAADDATPARKARLSWMRSYHNV